MNTFAPLPNLPKPSGIPSHIRLPQPVKPSRSTAAKRLANTKHLDQQQWLEVRKQGIGSSDAATACGLNPYMSMLELWMIKTGRVQQKIEDESSGHAPLYWGKQLEPLIQQIIHAERTFWACVEQDIPPAVDASESAARALQQLYPEHVPLTVEDLSHDETANLLFEKLIQARQQIEEQQQSFDQIKHEIQMLMKDAERATFNGGSVVWRKSKDSVSLDAKSLLKQQPELIEQYPLHKQGSRRFNIYTDA